jgi:VWFA-related protein
MTPVVALAIALAQAQQPTTDDLPVFRSETNLALVRFHVVYKKQYIANLKPEQIELLEDGKPQKITLFEGGIRKGRTTPVELILVFDTSGSVIQEGLLDFMAFKRELLDTIPNATISVYRFETRMRRLAVRTRNPEELRQAFAALDKRNPAGTILKLEQHAGEKDRKRGIGGSPIYEAVMEAARDASTGPANVTRQILIFSDGFETSTTKPETAAKYVQELGIPVYPVVLGHQKIVERIERGVRQQVGDGRTPNPPSNDLRNAEAQQQRIERFASLGEQTGGRHFDPRFFTPESLRNILQFMVGQVRNEYVAGYSPAPSGSEKKKTHKLTVRLKDKEFGKLLGGTRLLTR